MSKQKATANALPSQQTVNTFLANLRLLNLDRTPDWPSIDAHILRSRDNGPNQKIRIQYAEWTLYRLFEIWDLTETENKLRMFFPAYEPLQSLNLRAALFRCLNQLKTLGTLGKEVILRKTMFDDCKGEKFLDLLAAFSSLVLRRVVAAGPEGKGSIAQRLCTADTLAAKETRSLLPLAIAHRASLRGILKKKTELRARYRDFGRVLDLKEKELDLRFDNVVETQVFLDKNVAAEATVARVTKQFSEHWQGDGGYLDIITQGEGKPTKDTLLDRPFSDVWASVNEAETSSDLPNHPGGLLGDLESRVGAQNRRVKQWKAFKAEMQKHTKPVSPPKKIDLSSPKAKTISFHLQKEKDLVFSPRKSPRKSELPTRLERTPDADSPSCNGESDGHVVKAGSPNVKAASPVKAGGSFMKRRQSQLGVSVFNGSPISSDDNSGFSEIDEQNLTVRLEEDKSLCVQLPSLGSPNGVAPEGVESMTSPTNEPDAPVTSPAITTTANPPIATKGSHSPRPDPTSESVSSEDDATAARIIALTLNAAPTPQAKPPSPSSNAPANPWPLPPV
ncbi:MAG: hypothetical protein OHK93_007998 [Ramalina farinacea]|uniref:HAUS augmin-like complex subunit 6 N-terminal domain-containing protein n=1 Tax=Ramalina farinacea TaxID=258253 RepID=A0AA43QMS1_9LECA|nr:hypothetical protein [Ramalina farinacea]